MSTPSTPRTVRFANEAMMRVQLTDPLVEVDGNPIQAVRIGKLTVGDYRRHTEGGGRTEVLALPMFFDEAGQPLAIEVMDGLSFRDAQAVTEVATSFLNPPSRDEAKTLGSA